MATDAAPRARAATAGSLAIAARALGALALLAMGAIHLQQYLDLYSGVPTIGTLFVLNFVGATVVGLGLLVPLERRLGDAVLALLLVAGIGQAATAFVFLAISERTSLFGFQEPGYDPTAILASRVAEVAAVLLLTGYFAARFAKRRPRAGR
jgi:hypothetical protein